MNLLRERDRRRYAAIEATKLGHGGVVYIRRLLNCNAKTIGQGKLELDHSPMADELACQRKKTAAARRRKLVHHKLSKTFGSS